MSLDSYKFHDAPQPTRGPGAHEPVEMKELISIGTWWTWDIREWECPVCDRFEERFKEDLPPGFVGITCFGDAVMEGVEG